MVFCPECGAENRNGAHFCQNCGEKLSNQINHNSKSNFNHDTPEVPRESWTNKCPVCMQGKLFFHDQKGMLGLTSEHTYECENCGAIFKQKGDKYKLKTVSNQSYPTWKEYGNLTLTKREWENIANGGVSDKKQEDSDINSWLSDAQNGLVKFSDINSPVILKKDESAIMALGGISLYEPRAVRDTRGVYGGPSFRVAKGVSFRMGAFNAQSVSHDELKQIDTGILTLTDRRMIFIGNKRTTNIDLRKIIAIEPFKDGIASQRENKQKTEHFIGTTKNSLYITANGRNYNLPANGIVLKCIIEGLIKNIG